jgi:AcrR family transcriptional regulator
MNIVQEESLRDRKKSRRRLPLIEIARGLIATKGLRSLKVRDVAEAADCSIGSVYNEFGDFEGLILTVKRETVQALTAYLALGTSTATSTLSAWQRAKISGASVSMVTRWSPASTPTCCTRCSNTGC